MTVSELKKTLITLPEDAVVYIEAAHGNMPEKAGGIIVSYNPKCIVAKAYYGDDLQWEDPKKFTGNETAILIR